MQYHQRQQILNKEYNFGTNMCLPESEIQVIHSSFKSNYISKFDIHNSYFSDKVIENDQFQYAIFQPSENMKNRDAIILLHGLNERYWNKYLTWAEYLCAKTGKAIILFPIAYHINRSPCEWTNPRLINSSYQSRLQKVGNNQSVSLANIAFSERIAENPLRFYNSGKQTINDLTQLINIIQKGQHPLFEQNTKIDFFAYSIGAFMAQIAFLANPEGLLTNSKLFMFCGGSIFSSMLGESRLIMDKVAFEKLYNFYQYNFNVDTIHESANDYILQAFYSMICTEHDSEKRMNFFKNNLDRISGISIKSDKVIPYTGIENAMGISIAHECIELLEANYNFTHETPFPTNQPLQIEDIDKMFIRIFETASNFFKN